MSVYALYSRAAQERTERVDQVTGHDASTGSLTLLLGGVRPDLVHDLVHVGSQVTRTDEALQQVVQVQACGHVIIIFFFFFSQFSYHLE